MPTDSDKPELAPSVQAIEHAPDIIKQYPIGKEPKSLERELKVPGAPMPPPKGTIKRISTEEKGRLTRMVVSYPQEATPGETLVIDALVELTTTRSRTIAVTGTYLGGSLDFKPADVRASPGQHFNFSAVLTMPESEIEGTLTVTSFVWDALLGKWQRDANFTFKMKLRKKEAEPVAEKPASSEGLDARYPRVLTMAQYNRTWKPKGWKILFIGPTATWRQEYGHWEAIREIVQNALDEAESYSSAYDNLGLFIADKGKGVAVSDFLLGPPKLKPSYARGKYGQGMKEGALALVRDGYPVYVETIGRELYIIFMEQETDTGKVESLAALWKPNGTREGTIWHIINYRGDNFADRFAVNLTKTDIIATCPSLIAEPEQRYNQLIQHAFPDGSRIFARDIYMKNIVSPYSYNLWSFEVTPERNIPKSEDDMWRDAGRVWSHVKDVDHLRVFLTMVADPPLLEADENNRLSLNYMGLLPGTYGRSYGSIMVKNKTAWQKAWAEVFGNDVVIRTSARWDPAVKHLDYRSQSVQWNVRESLGLVIKTDRNLIDESHERLRDVAVVPDNKLTPRQLACLELARYVVSHIYMGELVSAIHAAIIPPASDRTRTAGLYGTITREIYIAVDQLEHGQATFDTLVHELAHHISEAEDGIPAHYIEISHLAGVIASEAAKGEYRSYLANPEFRW